MTLQEERLERLGRIETKLDENAKKLDAALEALFGNGREGIKTQVAVLAERMDAIETQRRPWREVWPSIVSGSVVAAFGLLVGLVIGWIV